MRARKAQLESQLDGILRMGCLVMVVEADERVGKGMVGDKCLRGVPKDGRGREPRAVICVGVTAKSLESSRLHFLSV